MVSLRQKDHVLRLLAAGVALTEIAKRTGVDRRMVHRLAKAEGLLPPPKPPKPWAPKKPQPERRPRGPSAWQVRLALTMLRDGETCTAVAEGTGISGRTAAKIARTYGLPVRKRGAVKGEKGVPLALRAAALRMVREGATLAYAGAQVGVSRQAVHQWAQAEGLKVGRRRKRKTAQGGHKSGRAKTGNPSAGATPKQPTATAAMAATLAKVPEMA